MNQKIKSQARQLPLEFSNGHTPSTVIRSSCPGIDLAFPVEEANALAAHESYNKHLFRPNTYLHKWWARRSGTTFRYILKQLSEDPDKRDYYAPGGLEGKIVFDPMMGGGTTVHEALRLGASVIGCDIDPIPVLQAQASLIRLPLAEKITVFEDFYQRVADRLAPLFTTACSSCGLSCETQFVLYGVRKMCQCGEAILIDSLKLREEPDGSVIELDPYSGHTFVGDRPKLSDNIERRIYEKSIRACPTCNTPYTEIKNIPFWERYVPLVVVGSCDKHGQFFKKAGPEDFHLLETSRRLYEETVSLPYDRLAVSGGPKSNDLLSRSVSSYADLFTPRQAIYMATCKRLLEAVDDRHRLWLALLISTSLEFNSLLCGYKGFDKRRPGAIRHVFSHHAYSFPYTALENNPIFSGNTSGTLRRLFRDRIQAATLWAENPVERKHINNIWKKVELHGEVDGGTQVSDWTELLTEPRRFFVSQRDSSRLSLPNNCVDHVVTDPPYYDSVQYSDLAQFFRVWLRWMLPNAADWDYDVVNSAVAETSQNGAKYQKVLSAIWAECHRVLKKPNGRLIFTFHHWRAEAWAHLTVSLKQAGFRLVTSYTVHSENPISVHIRQLNALKHDSILVFSPSAREDKTPQFELLEKISTTDSFRFCSDCARLLGYCLEANLTEQQITQTWRTAIGI